MGKFKNMADRRQAGFTLVELAIVMIIIGLLIGGVLKGQALIANAQITATASAVKGIDAATTTFHDTYAAMPGDMRGATTRLPNCAGTCAFDGDGNSRVDDDTPLDAQDSGSPDENVAFWGHLAAADLLSGIDMNGGNIFGEAFPSAPIGGGWQMGWNAATTLGSNTSARAGHYLTLFSDPPGTAPSGAALTALQAARMDRKLDDGIPTTGTVFTKDGTTSCTNTTTGGYDEANGAASCDLLIRFQN